MKFLLILSLFALSQGFPSKIDPAVRKALESKGSANIFLELVDGTEPILAQVRAQFKESATHGEKTTQVYNALKSHSDASQVQILDLIRSDARHGAFQSFWINNMIYIRGAETSFVHALASLAQVKRIVEEPTLDIRNFYAGSYGPSFERKSPRAEWGLEQMRVPEVWDMPGGNRGEGTIVGNIDTGVRGTHELLRDKWVGLEGLGWWDPEQRTSAPYDVYNHGTHVTGNLIGDNGIGIVPDARWLACKAYRDDGSGVASTFLSCIEYMLCPNDFEGNNRDCTKAPHVVSNSWGWYGGETMFNSAISAWVTAGILASFSSGNTGPDCVSVYSPADQPIAIAVGASDSSNSLASFSSLGPSPYGDLKPEITAPGVGIYSSSAASDTAYMNASGTSMSCPHASGVLALLKTFNRNLSHQEALDALTSSAVRDLPSRGDSCGEMPDSELPNNHFGHGVIDAYAAMEYLMTKE